MSSALCRFFNSPGGCHRKNCRYLHEAADTNSAYSRRQPASYHPYSRPALASTSSNRHRKPSPELPDYEEDPEDVRLGRYKTTRYVDYDNKWAAPATRPNFGRTKHCEYHGYNQSHESEDCRVLNDSPPRARSIERGQAHEPQASTYRPKNYDDGRAQADAFLDTFNFDIPQTAAPPKSPSEPPEPPCVDPAVLGRACERFGTHVKDHFYCGLCLQPMDPTLPALDHGHCFDECVDAWGPPGAKTGDEWIDSCDFFDPDLSRPLPCCTKCKTPGVVWDADMDYLMHGVHSQSSRGDGCWATAAGRLVVVILCQCLHHERKDGKVFIPMDEL